MNITFGASRKDNCSLFFGKHINGSTALVIQDEYGHPLVNVTKLHLDYVPDPGSILVKNYAENKGILDCLTEQGILSDTGLTIPAGYTELNLCTLLVDPKTYQGD